MQNLLGGVAIGLGEKAAGVQVLDQGSALAADAEPGDLQLVLGQFGWKPLVEPEVEEGDATVSQQHEVPGVGVAGELVMAVHAAEVEAEDDLGDAVALLRVGAFELLEPGTADKLADHHALARQ